MASVTDLLGRADGELRRQQRKVAIFTDWHAIGTGDFNGDGRDDILWQNDNGTVREWLGQADGSFAGNIEHVNFLAAAGSQLIGTGDFNGDGFDDLLWQSSDGRVTDLLGQAGGGFVDNYTKVSIVTDWHAIGTGDFNGDGRADVLWQNANGTVREWLGQSDGTFVGNTAHVNFVAAAGAHVIEIGDFNGDRIDDLLVVEQRNGHVLARSARWQLRRQQRQREHPHRNRVARPGSLRARPALLSRGARLPLKLARIGGDWAAFPNRV